MAENKPKHNIRPIIFSDLKEGFYSQQARIDAFAKELGMDKYVLRDYINKAANGSGKRSRYSA